MKDDFERSCIRSYVDQDLLMSLRADIAQHANLERHAEILAMLADPTRLKILYSLKKGGELCVCDIADILDKEVSAISHQLRRLKDRGLVKNRRDGLTIYYRLAASEECRAACELAEAIFSPSRDVEFA